MPTTADTSSLAASTGVRRGTAASVAASSPVERSVLTTSTPKTATSAYANMKANPTTPTPGAAP